MRRMCAGHKLIRHAKHRDEHAYYSTAWAALIWCIPSDKMGSSPSSPPPAPPSFNLLQTNHVVSSSQTKRERERGWERAIEGERERKRARERIGVGLGAASSLRRQQADLSEGERITSVDLICQFFFSQSSTTEPSPNPPSTTHHLHSAVQKR